jgi:hypothetical protein
MNAPLRRQRLQLVLIFAVFFVPIALAFLLRGIGWQPQGMRNVGELVQPPQDLSALALHGADGSAFAWKDPDYRWTLLLLGGSSCERQCLARLGEAEAIRLLLTQKATRVRIAYVGPLPEASLRARFKDVQFLDGQADALLASRPVAADSVAALLVDPVGLLVVRHAPGYAPEGVRKDLSRLIR